MKKSSMILLLGCALLAVLFFSKGSYSITQAANDSGLTTHQTDLFLQSASENSSSLPFPELKPIPAGEVAEISATISYEAGVGNIHEIHHQDADFIKVRFAEMDLLPGDYVTVSDPAGEEVYTYPGSDFTTDDDPGFWALSITGDTAVVELHTTNQDSLNLPTGQSLADYGIQINKYTHGFPGILDAAENLGVGSQSTCGTNQRTDVACYQSSHPTEFGKSNAVARMLLNNGSSLCTGWRIGPNADTLMTNEHCISSQSETSAAEAWFNYQRTSCGGSMASEVKVTGNNFLVDSYDYDFALITINNAASVASFGYLEVDARTPILGEEIYIPQHGSGNPKEFGIESDMNNGNVCRIDDAINNGRATNSDTGYYCDTIGGSSGSPVLARSSHKVIAIHHFGISGSTCNASNMNGGVRMDLIWPMIEPFLDTTPSTPTPTSTALPPTATNTPSVPTNTPSPGSCVTYNSSGGPIALPNGTTSISSNIAVSGSGTINDVNVSLDMAHAWPGDLTFTLTHQGTGTAVTLVDRPGVPASSWGCSVDNILATLDDGAALPVENQCNASPPAISGSYTPNNPLSNFNGLNGNGTWVLTVADAYTSADAGTLNGWSVEICTGSVVPTNTPPPSTPTDVPPTSTPVGPTATPIVPTPTATPSSGICTSPQYVAGTSYATGDLVQNVGNEYQCTVGGWCSSIAAWAYEPGAGMYWETAWSFARTCN